VVWCVQCVARQCGGSVQVQQRETGGERKEVEDAARVPHECASSAMRADAARELPEVIMRVRSQPFDRQEGSGGDASAHECSASYIERAVWCAVCVCAVVRGVN